MLTTTQAWTQTPKAAALLASCVARPPVWRFETYGGLVHDVTVAEYVGARVEQLKKLRQDWIEEQSGCDWSENSTTEAGHRWFDLHETQPAVDAAIDAAIAAAARQREAA